MKLVLQVAAGILLASLIVLVLRFALLSAAVSSIKDVTDDALNKHNQLIAEQQKKAKDEERMKIERQLQAEEAASLEAEKTRLKAAALCRWVSGLCLPFRLVAWRGWSMRVWGSPIRLFVNYEVKKYSPARSGSRLIDTFFNSLRPQGWGQVFHLTSGLIPDASITRSGILFAFKNFR